MQQLLAEYALVNPQIVVLDDLRLQAGEPHEFGHGLLPFLRGQGIALLQRRGVFTPGKFAGLGERPGQIGLQIGRQFFVELGRRRVGRQIKRERQVVSRLSPDRAEIQHSRNQNQAVQIQPVT